MADNMRLMAYVPIPERLAARLSRYMERLVLVVAGVEKLCPFDSNESGFRSDVTASDDKS